MADLALLEKLCSLPGVSGEEEAVREAILEEIRPYADAVSVTPLGNILVQKKGKVPSKTKLMLSAHMDEVGLIVTNITDKGLLKFDTVGGILKMVLCGRSVTVLGKNGPVNGVMGCAPVHLMKGKDEDKPMPVEDLSIDIGAANREEAARYVSPGDRVVFDSIWDASRGRIISKALDDRAGCVILIDLIKKDLPCDMTFAFTVQEEVGLYGAQTAANAVRPQAAIVVESTTAADVPGVTEENKVCRVGKGPVVSFMDRRTIYDKIYYRMAMDAAEEKGIPCQPKLGVAGGNDAGAIAPSGEGVRTIAVSLPCRYLHSAFSMISEEDFHHGEELVLALAERIAMAPPETHI